MKKYIVLALFIVLGNKVSIAQTDNIVIPDGHAGVIEKMILSADGKYLYTANNQKIIMWDINNHKQLYSFKLAEEMSIINNAIQSFVLSKDGDYVAVTGYFGVKCFSTITGKSVFSDEQTFCKATFSANSNKLYYTGAMQDPKSYSRIRGILSVNLQTLIIEPLFICAESGTCNFREIEILKTGMAMLKYKTGWQIADLDAKKIIYTSDVDTKTISFGRIEEKVFLPVPNTNLIVAKEQIKGNNNTYLNFYDAYSGTKLFAKQISNDWKVIPSVDGKTVFLDPGYGTRTLELIDIKNGGNTLKNINKVTIGMNDEENLVSGIISANYKRIYINAGEEVKEIELPTLKTAINFKKEIAGLPVLRNYDFNERNEKIRIVADFNNFLTVDLKRMAVEKNYIINNNDNDYLEINFSPSGDTISIEGESKAYFYNIKSGKKTNISPALFGKPPFESKPRPNLFFGKEGKYAYALKNIGDRSDAQVLYQINIATNLSKKIAAFHHNLEIDIKQDIIIGYDKTPTSFVVKCWQLATGKQIFNKTISRKSEEPKLISAKVFDGLSKMLLVSKSYVLTYNMANGNLLNSSKETLFSWEDSYFISHNANLIMETNNTGRLAFYSSTLNNESVVVQAHPGSINTAYFSNNDNLIYTIGSDNTIKIFKTSNGKLIGTLYVFKDSKDYVFIDPTGRFDGTPEGIKKLYYVKDRKIITLDKIYERFYTPNLYQRLLNGEQFEPINIIIKPSPLAKITYEQKTRNLTVEDDSKPNYNNTTGLAEITINATAQDDTVDEIRLFHNGKAVNLATRGLFVTDAGTSTDSKKYSINLLPGQNTFRAVALNSQRTESLPDEITVNYALGNQPINNKPNLAGVVVDAVDKTATLHLVVVGINKYQNEKLSLNYALADATAFKNEIEKDAKSIITNIKTYFVTDAQADKKGITDALTQVQKTAKAQDVFVFYYAGHGVISEKNKEFYLVPTDVADLKNVDVVLEQKGIAAKLLQNYAVDIPAQKQLFILDACQSAGAFEAMLTTDGNQQKSLAVVARATGTHWMAASGAQQFANEFAQLGHGAFTYVLLQALKGEAANNKMITVNGLKNFLQQQVPALMKKYNGSAQYPASYGFGNDFPVEVILK